MASKKTEMKLSNGWVGSGLFWAISYSVISITITLFNKAVLSSYGM